MRIVQTAFKSPFRVSWVSSIATPSKNALAGAEIASTAVLGFCVPFGRSWGRSKRWFSRHWVFDRFEGLASACH